MKFCYLDESGTGEEPYAVMVGVIVDAKRMHLTKGHWQELLQVLSDIVGRSITEIHTRDFYAGNNLWRGIDGQQRAAIISAIFAWLRDRKHHIVYSAVDKNRFLRDFQNEPQSGEIGSLWRFLALHNVLAIQKHFQKQENNKGNTVLIFDNEVREAKNFTQLTLNPPEWSDSYYNRSRRRAQLDQIIDVPYFGDSQQVGLIQVADFISFFMRRFIEVQEGAAPARYADEPVRLNGWMDIAFGRALPKSVMYPSRSRCACADLFYRYAPSCLL